jgi:hypothetical protein
VAPLYTIGYEHRRVLAEQLKTRRGDLDVVDV